MALKKAKYNISTEEKFFEAGKVYDDSVIPPNLPSDDFEDVEPVVDDSTPADEIVVEEEKEAPQSMTTEILKPKKAKKTK